MPTPHEARRAHRKRRPSLPRQVTRAIAAAFLVALCLIPAAARAHSELERSTPAEGQRLSQAPDNVELQFNQVIAAEFVTLTLTTATRPPLALKTEVDGETVLAGVPRAETGRSRSSAETWTLAYRVVSADGHPISGSVRFQVGPTTEARAAPSSTASNLGQSDPDSDEHGEPAGAGETVGTSPGTGAENNGKQTSGGLPALAFLVGLAALLTASLFAWPRLRNRLSSRARP